MYVKPILSNLFFFFLQAFLVLHGISDLKAQSLTVAVLVSPANGATNQPNTVTLKWNATPGANQYKVALGTTVYAAGTVVWDTTYSDTSMVVPNLVTGTTYYWRIKAKKTSPYQSSSWSGIRSFTVGPLVSSGSGGGTTTTTTTNTLMTPTCVSPSNNSSLQVPGTNLVWNIVSGATYYKVKVATDPSMTNIVFQDSNVTVKNRVAQNLNYNTLYYWTVQAGNATSVSPVSSIRNFKTCPDNPNAVTTHPRILFDQSDLNQFQTWTVNNNAVYIALKNALNTAISNYNSVLFPGGQPNPNYPDNGGTTWSGYVTESYAEFFAFWSLIDPVLANRPVHAQRARNLLMYVMDRAYLGPAAGVPFRDPQFSCYDRSRIYGEAFGLTVDWIYNAKDANNNDILTAADKSKIRTVFLRWSNEQLSAYNHPTPIGLMNDKQIQITNRWILNNYFSGHARNLTYMALSMDAADDPEVNPALHFSALGNTLRSYIYNVTGAWLYQQYAQYEKPEIVSIDYGVPATGLGMGSGGCSVEGSLYGASIGWVAQECLALKKSGWLDSTIIGKQAKLFYSDYWSRLTDGLLHTMAPIAVTPPQASYLGPVYFGANYGDLLRSWVTPELLDETAGIGLIDLSTGSNPARLDKVRWFIRNGLQGGNGLLAQRISNVWASSYGSYGIYYFLLLNPAGSNPADPRPSMANTFYDSNFGRLLARTDWTSNARWFNWQCHWTKINHQAGDGNQFELYRKGEWLIKEKSGYTNDNIGTTSQFHNTLALQNTVPPNMQWYEGPISQRGAQWKEGLNAGDPKNTVSLSHPEFIYATGDATNLYNRVSGASDIEYASRSIVWLKPDHIIVYDRAKSFSQNKFKRFFLQFTSMPSVNGKNVTVNTPGGQKVYLTNLLPSASVLTSSLTESLSVTAELESVVGELKIEDPSNPQNVRFLNVIQGSDGTGVKDVAQLVQSTSGNLFDGVVLNNMAILFSTNWATPFDSTRYTVPSTVTQHLVSGLLPNMGYMASMVPNGSGYDITIKPGNQFVSDSGGVLFFQPVALANRTAAAGYPSFDFDIIPNPVKEQAEARFYLADNQSVHLVIMDITGRIVKTILSNTYMESGMHYQTIQTDGLSAGTYLCRLTIKGVEHTKKIVIMSE